MSERIVLAVDGGNSKTELALVREDGELLAFVRGDGSSPHHLGIERSFDVLDGLFARAAEEAHVEAPVAVAQLLLAGVDFPSEVKLAVEHAANRGWAIHSTVDNDTFAVLRAGTDRGWGVAIVCGAGINCVGVAPDGRHTRFPALGRITGDWGGGQDLGIAAVSAAARSEDGRGPHTTLERTVPAHFGLGSPSELAEAIHFGRIAETRLVELAPVVLAEAADDPVAASIRDRLATEVVALARVADRPARARRATASTSSSGAGSSSPVTRDSSVRWTRGCARSRRTPRSRSPRRRRFSAPRCSGWTSSALPHRRTSASGARSPRPRK